MNQTTAKVNLLVVTLDAAAPDKDSWLRGEAAFAEMQQTDPGNNEAAFIAALDAAAPDEESWLNGEQALLLHGGPALSSPPATKRFSLEAVKSHLPFQGGQQSDKSAARQMTKVVLVCAFWLLIIVIGMCVFLTIQPGVFSMYDTTFGVGTGTAASVAAFVIIAGLSLLVGKMFIRLIRKRNTTTPSTTS